MTLRQFNYLSEQDQRFILSTKAVFVSALEDGEDSYRLFQVDGFYVEIYCAGGENCRLSTINYFEEADLLEPYLESINIDFVYTILN